MANDPNTIQYVIQEDGFWYVASKDRTPGVPGITVSSKGIANGLSTEYNDGYDFGPDSYNPSVTSGVPLTQTAGIQEAENYIESHTMTFSPTTISPRLQLLDGIFSIKNSIKIGYISQSQQGFGVYGIDQMLTYIIPETNSPIFQVNPSYLGQITFADMQALPQSGYTPDSIVNWNPTISSAATLIILHLNGGSGGWKNGTLNISMLANVVMFDHERYNTGYNISHCERVTDIGGTNDINAYGTTTGDATVISNLTNVGEVTITGAWIGWYNLNNIDNIIIIGNQFQGLVLTGDVGFLYVYAGGSYLNTFANPSTYTTPTFLLNESGGTVNIGTFDFELAYWFRQTGYQFSNSNITYNNIKNIEFTAVHGTTLPTLTLPYNTPSTPTVPDSGTAQSNSNPYAVKVYVNGGALTKIQITIGSTTYTVYSNSTASAVYEGFTLPAGASITLTYSTAPTWSWLPE